MDYRKKRTNNDEVEKHGFEDTKNSYNRKKNVRLEENILHLEVSSSADESEDLKQTLGINEDSEDFFPDTDAEEDSSKSEEFNDDDEIHNEEEDDVNFMDDDVLDDEYVYNKATNEKGETRTAWGKKTSTFYDKDLDDENELTEDEEMDWQIEEANQIMSSECNKDLSEDDFELTKLFSSENFDHALLDSVCQFRNKHGDGDISTAQDNDSLDNMLIDTSKQKKIILSNRISDLTQKDKKAILRKYAPELKPLLGEFQSTFQTLFREVKPIIRKSFFKSLNDIGIAYLDVKHELLLIYLLYISFYFQLKKSNLNVSNHPVIKRLLDVKSYMKKLEPVEEVFRVSCSKVVPNLRSKNDKKNFLRPENSVDNASLKHEDNFNKEAKLWRKSDIVMAVRDFIIKNPDKLYDKSGMSLIKRAAKHLILKPSFFLKQDNYKPAYEQQMQNNVKEQPKNGVQNALLQSADSLYEDATHNMNERSYPTYLKFACRMVDRELKIQNNFSTMADTLVFNTTVNYKNECNNNELFNEYSNCNPDEKNIERNSIMINKKDKNIPIKYQTTELAEGKRGTTRNILKNIGLRRIRKKYSGNARVANRMKFEKKLKKHKAKLPQVKEAVENYSGDPFGLQMHIRKSIKLD